MDVGEGVGLGFPAGGEVVGAGAPHTIACGEDTNVDVDVVHWGTEEGWEGGGNNRKGKEVLKMETKGLLYACGLKSWYNVLYEAV